MRRLILVYNPRSSHFWQVEEEVIAKARKLPGVMLAKYEVLDTDVDDNATRLSKIILDGDMVVAAGGDGTANIAMNGVMLSGASGVKFGVMAYGNFNDTVAMLGKMSFEEIIEGGGSEIWPLECFVNDKHWRYALCYVTAGMFAEACMVFDEPKVRKKLQKKHSEHFVSSLWSLVKWWLRERKREFLPDFRLDNSDNLTSASDFMAVNSPKVARLMKGGRYFESSEEFLSYSGEMRKFFKLFPMMFASVFRQVPGKNTSYACLNFKDRAELVLQAEGEYKKMKNVKKIEVKKAERPILVVRK